VGGNDERITMEATIEKADAGEKGELTKEACGLFLYHNHTTTQGTGQQIATNRHRDTVS
jgi:hypothetical protein